MNDDFKMYCPKCGREYLVDAFEKDPKCELDGTGLDFERADEEKKKHDGIIHNQT